MVATPNRFALEDQFIADLRPIFAAEFDRARHSPTAIPYGQFQQQLVGVIAANLQQAFRAGGAVMPIGDGGLLITHGTFDATGRQWSLGYAQELATRAVNTSRTLADQAVSRIMYDPTIHPRERQQRIDAALSLVFLADRRLENLAITEVTRGISQGQNAVILLDNFRGGRRDADRLIAIWQTAEDERVCDVCEPFDGTSDAVWGQKFPSGPPAHPRCRCERKWVPVSLWAARAA